MTYFAGIDIGSTSIKIVLTNESGRHVASTIMPTGSHFYKNTVDAFDNLLEQEEILKSDIAYIVSTGYGRKLFKDADESISEITANALGVREVSSAQAPVRTIINIGGQDLKVILLNDDGNVKNFVMNDRCAAGTGKFLEIAARNLELNVDELGAYHLNAKGVPLTISSTCTVFAESEIISLLAHGHGKEEIIAGLHYSIAKRVVRLAGRVGVEDKVFFDGGPALNRGMVNALEDELARDVIVPDIPQITTASGAASLARERCLTMEVSIHD